MNNNLIPAATVLVLRDSDDGMEVLMVKRSKRPPFENLYVFPGGKIDKEDHFDDYQKYCNVLNNKIASEKLGLDSGGLSYWIACIRECFEEIGILLAKNNLENFLTLME
jgi:NTP pyrophosphohydrolases including oxidative damage repair enzymes